MKKSENKRKVYFFKKLHENGQNQQKLKESVTNNLT